MTKFRLSGLFAGCSLETGRENLQLLQFERVFMKVVVFDGGLERWAKASRCFREALLPLWAKWGALFGGDRSCRESGDEATRKELLLVQNVYPKEACQEQVGNPGRVCVCSSVPWGQDLGARGLALAPCWQEADACLRVQWGCGSQGLVSAAFGCGHRSVGVGVGSVSRLWQGVLLGVHKESRNKGKSKIIHFHIRGCWTVATSLPFNSPDHPKKQHVKGKKEKKKTNWRNCSEWNRALLVLWMWWQASFSTGRGWFLPRVFLLCLTISQALQSKPLPPSLYSVPGGSSDSLRNRINGRDHREFSVLTRPRPFCQRTGAGD